MNSVPTDGAWLQRQEQALLAVIEADRARQCAQALAEAHTRANAVRAQARAEALARLRSTFAEQRQRRQQRLAAALARMATRRRLHEQQRVAQLLQRAAELLPQALLALWQEPNSRAAWAQHVLASARQQMPQGPWHVHHAPDWPLAEQPAPDGGAPAMMCIADADISAGLKVLAHGNVIDGTLAGLLAEPAQLQARLLRLLEGQP